MIYIKVLKYRGKSGGFATQETDRWTVSLVNEEKELEISLDSFMSEGYGYSTLEYALQSAQPYFELLDIPIRQFDCKVHTHYRDDPIWPQPDPEYVKQLAGGT